MRLKRMGTDGPEVPVVCFGTWPLGGAYGGFEESGAISTMHAAMDAGLTFIDTARRVHERRGHHRQVDQGPPRRAIHSYQGLRRRPLDRAHPRGAEQQPAAHGHGPRRPVPAPPGLPIGPSRTRWPTCSGSGTTAKIRYIGISNFSAEEIDEAAGFGRIHSGQPRYNMLFREVEDDLLPAYQRNGIGVMAHSVLAKGLLGGRYKPGDTFPLEDEALRVARIQGRVVQADLRSNAAPPGMGEGPRAGHRAACHRLACRAPRRVHQHRRRQEARGPGGPCRGGKLGAVGAGAGRDRGHPGRPPALHGRPDGARAAGMARAPEPVLTSSDFLIVTRLDRAPSTYRTHKGVTKQ